MSNADQSYVQRYKSVRRLAQRLLFQILWWDVILNRPLLRRFRPSPGPRWRRMTIEYRNAALAMGGVLIKIGQNISARVDLFPSEVTEVLSELRDNVPPAPYAEIQNQIEEDFRAPLHVIFPVFNPIPVGSASLGQVYNAALPNGERVVVKVLRPGIVDLVRTDLDVVSKFTRLLQSFRRVRRHMDLGGLMREFTAVTLRELDFQAEGRAAERFAQEFASDPGIAAPKIYWDLTRARTLTMEDVAYFPVGDVAAYEALGIDRREVARRLTLAYLTQIFVTGFVHADPHPGNLFVRPLPEPGDPSGPDGGPPLLRRGDPIPYAPGRKFQLVFIDFGMWGVVPPQARAAMRTYAMGIATRNPRAIIQAYIEGDMLLPDADLGALERMTEALMERAPQAFIGQVQIANMPQYAELLKEHQAVFYDSPFKLRTDLVLVFRAMGTCSGTVCLIDPNFDPSECFAPLAQRVMIDEWLPNLERMKRFIMTLLTIPGSIEKVLTKLDRGEISIDREYRRRSMRELRTLTNAARSLVFAVSGAVIAAIAAGVTFGNWGNGAFLGGLALALVGIATIFSTRRVRR